MKITILSTILSFSILFAQGITNTLGGDTADDKFIIENSSAEIGLVVTGENNVGIGTDNPLFKFDVSNLTADGSVASAVNAIDAGGAIAAYSSTFPAPFDHFADRFSLWSNAITAIGLDIRADGPTSDIRFYTGGLLETNERMRINSDGNVGIGTWSPDSKLHVLGDVKFTNGKTIMMGQVGIGTSDFPNSQTKLNINGQQVRIAGSQPYLILDNTSGAGFQSAINFRTNGVGTWSIYSDTGGSSKNNLSIDDAIANVTRLFISETGNVGINTTNPSGTLDVNGSIFQRGGQLHADYVFEEDYELESISEHTVFMWTNKHLPAVPKADLDSEGNEIVDIGTQRRGMLEELEKAHIYITQLEERISQIEQIIIKGN